MEISNLLLKSFGGQAKDLVNKYPGLLAELTTNIITVSEIKLSAKNEEERAQAEIALSALQEGCVASIMARIREDSLKAIAESAFSFAIQIVRATVLV